MKHYMLFKILVLAYAVGICQDISNSMKYDRTEQNANLIEPEVNVSLPTYVNGRKETVELIKTYCTYHFPHSLQMSLVL